MLLGTAKIIKAQWYEKPVYWVYWTNHGNYLRNVPRAFWTAVEAERWVAEQGLKLVGPKHKE